MPPWIADIPGELWALAGIAITAGLTYLATRSNGKDTAAQGLIDRFETRVTALESKVKTLEDERDQARAERDTANRRADDADDTLRDRNELVDDYMDHAAELLSWASAGAPPPPPVPSWRIRNHLADLAANAETLRNQQKEG